MRASPRDDAAARAASARGHGLLCASGAHEVILFGRAIGSWLRSSSAWRLLLLHLASVGARCRCAPDCTVAVKDMRGQSSGRRGQVGKAVCDAGAFAVALSSFVHTDPGGISVDKRLRLPVLHVVVLFDSSTSMQKQHIILKLSASSARCIQPRVPRAHGLRARLRVPLSLLSAPMAHRVVSLLVRLCVTLLDSVSDLRCSRYGPESIFV